ncbi:glycerophosphodiester phosphodiesterase family protein [Plantactinospora sp. KLBMP9567]|uniref:glycerophosphodiester phosphodiesterase family protein n=1 Tax=Plantactinospora sp. KLBMP9567 TaxID=3085900 RepID=UPI0029819757|nr:glycerophosphodiester phosphodiesterase family protein [Plantactinospora sp. KLBMP9567]MDW5329378.1 glycerophosphodiester phosphodiesterase family protein [Plantactinospora sp. KLBMP9567]
MSRRRQLIGALLVTAAVLAGMPSGVQAGERHRPESRRSFDLQAHRGGLGLRVENTLASFGNALQLGVRTLELDVQVTEDRQVVVTHDRRVSGTKCVDTAPATPNDPEFPYVGKYVNTLTLAQVRTLDCGTKTLADKPGQLAVPGARMPLLREVFALVKRYRADDVTLNVETKVEAGAPTETAPREQFVQLTVAEIRAAGLVKQVTVQSFDWGALMRMRQVEPRLPLVALTNYDFLQTGQPGASPWLGGLDIDDFGGDPISAIRSFGATAFSPVHGFPQNGTVTDPGYRPYVTREMVAHAHRNGIKVVPWTIDDVPTMAKLLDDGVDGIITDYPDRLRALLAQRRIALPKGYAAPFDIQAHRGGRATRPENTLPAFANALGNPAISTLELDTGVTRDGHLVVLHDRTVNGSHCEDTAPAWPGDRAFPYVGKRVHDLTLKQLRTIDCGSKTLPELPEQVAVPGARIPTLDEVFELVRRSGRRDVRLNVETKLSPLVADTEPYRSFTAKLVRAVERAGFTDRVTIQSFDWRTITHARDLNRRIETVALVWQYGPAECASLADECSLQAVYGDPSVRSPWTAGLDWWRYRDLGKLVRASGAGTVSANWQVHDPAQDTVPSADWYLRQDPAYFHGPTVADLQRRYGLKVVPYTVDDPATMQRVIDLGVDGIITDYPERLVTVAIRNGLR